jgi:hypothetical protein
MRVRHRFTVTKVIDILFIRTKGCRYGAWFYGKSDKMIPEADISLPESMG